MDLRLAEDYDWVDFSEVSDLVIQGGNVYIKLKNGKIEYAYYKGKKIKQFKSRITENTYYTLSEIIGYSYGKFPWIFS